MISFYSCYIEISSDFIALLLIRWRISVEM